MQQRSVWTCRCSKTTVCRYSSYPRLPSRVLMGEEKWETFTAEGACGWWSLWGCSLPRRGKTMSPSHRKGVSDASKGRKGIMAWSLHFGEEISCSCCGLVEFRQRLPWVLNKAGDTGPEKRMVCQRFLNQTVRGRISHRGRTNPSHIAYGGMNAYILYVISSMVNS